MRALCIHLQILIVALYGLALFNFLRFPPVSIEVVLGVSLFFFFLFSFTTLLREHTENRLINKRQALKRLKSVLKKYIFPILATLPTLITVKVSIELLDNVNLTSKKIADELPQDTLYSVIMLTSTLGLSWAISLLPLLHYTSKSKYFSKNFIRIIRHIAKLAIGIFTIVLVIFFVVPWLFVAFFVVGSFFTVTMVGAVLWVYSLLIQAF